jgi:2-phosphoglycerate kinase
MSDPVIISAILGGILTILGAIIGALISTERIILTNFFCWRRKLPPGFIIFISGVSGVGKTTISWALARKYNIVTVLGSELIREAIRCFISKDSGDSSQAIFHSSFLAHKHTSGGNVTEAYIRQSKILLEPMIKVINRIRRKRRPAIITGVNLIASQLFSKIPNDTYNKVLLINLYLASKQNHIYRLRERGTQRQEPAYEADRYTENIDAIREINQFLKDDAQRLSITDDQAPSNVIFIENSGSISKAVNIIDKHLKKKLKILGKVGT